MWHMQLFKQIALKPDFSGPIKSLNSIYSKLSKCHLRLNGSHGTITSLWQGHRQGEQRGNCPPEV